MFDVLWVMLRAQDDILGGSRLAITPGWILVLDNVSSSSPYNGRIKCTLQKDLPSCRICQEIVHEDLDKLSPLSLSTVQCPVLLG